MIEQPALAAGQTLLYTLRHGLTELNRSKRTGGRLDAPLIEEGRRQAEEARVNLDGTPLDVVIASSLRRAIETAQIVTGWDRGHILIEELAIERSFGEMEGLTQDEIRVRFPFVVYLPIEHVRYSLNPPGGESFDCAPTAGGGSWSRLIRTSCSSSTASCAGWIPTRRSGMTS